jgi:CDP-diacylglycerol---glycerol-3-phosphate 3-phosphatidyltransferase
MPLNLPNRITLARLVLTIIFFAVIAQYSHRAPQSWLLDLGLVIFIVAAATDFLDGYYARKRNQVTALGRILDPFVDKVLVCGAFVFLSGPGFCDEAGYNVTGVRSWMIVLIVGRELLVTGLRGFSESRGIEFGAAFVGKAKMWVQTVTICVLLLCVALGASGSNSTLDYVQSAFVWLTVLATTASLMTYLVKSRHIFTETPS